MEELSEIEVLELQLEYHNRVKSKANRNYQVISKLISKNGIDNLYKYLRVNNFNKVVIYGSGTVGKILFEILKKFSNIKIQAILDKNSDSNFDFDCFEINNPDKFIECDVVIVTPVFAYETIKKEISLIYDNVISIADII